MIQTSKIQSTMYLTKKAMHIVDSEKIDSPELTNTLQKLLEVTESTTEQDIEAPSDMATLLAGEDGTLNGWDDAIEYMRTIHEGRL